MNRPKLLFIDRASSFLLTGVILMAAFSARAQNVQHLSATVPGGMPGLPILTGTNLITNGTKVTGLQVTWDGPSGYYQLFESPSTNNPRWVALTRHNILARNATVPVRYSNAFFKVSGPLPSYGGVKLCTECHAPILNTEIHTLHAGAFTNARFEADGGQTNSSCLACHTVGFDLPTGFISQSETPHLAGVQCENCHGGAARHAANPDDPSVRPRAEVAAQVCGGCHNDPRHPTFDEWTNSGHAQVVVMGTNTVVTKATNTGTASWIKDCGRCHSGSVRVALVDGTPLPTDDADVGIVCATCHNPHQTNGNPAQLRNPVASTNDFSLPTNVVFASYYKTNVNINICAQCHNRAGASWTNNECEPHHSAQYNMLLGTIGELESGLPPYQPASHALRITNQCVGCHMQTSPFVSAAQPAVTGHSFKVEQYSLCIECHGLNETLFPSFLEFVTNSVSSQVQEIKLELDLWATSTNAPASLSAKYGNLAWEYTTPGNLSSGGPGPNAKEQLLIPENIRKARFNLYVVQNEGSLGIHNPIYTVTLLNAAEDWLEQELEP